MRKLLINNKLIGALTSKPYSFKSRSWELKYLESIDLYDSLGSNIKINYRGSNILRILPNINENINEEWITDKIRFSYDSLYRWRFNVPLVKDWNKNIYQQLSWKNIFFKIKETLKKKNIQNINGYLGPYADLESTLLFKDTLNTLGNFNLIKNNKINLLDNDFIYANLLNNNFLNKEHSNQIYIFIGINLRLENPILNLKFRKLSKKKNILIGYIGGSYNATCYMYNIGNNVNTLLKLLEGKHWFSIILYKYITKNNNFLSNFQNEILFIFGNNILNRIDSTSIFNSINVLSKNIKCTAKVLYSLPGDITGDILNFNNNIKKKKKPTLHYLLGTETFEYKDKNDIVIYQGHHNDLIRKKMNIILPSKTFLESTNLYVNCLNILQQTKGINIHLNQIKKNLEILSLLGKYTFNLNLNYANALNLAGRLEEIIGKKELNKINLFKNYFININLFLKINNSNFKNITVNYYLSNSMSRASKNMINCSKHNFLNKYIYLWK